MASAGLSNKTPRSTVLLSWTSPPLGWAELNAYGCMILRELLFLGVSLEIVLGISLQGLLLTWARVVLCLLN